MAKITITIDDNKYEAIKLQNINIENELHEKVETLYKRVPKSLRTFIDKVADRKKKTVKRTTDKTKKEEENTDEVIERDERNDRNNSEDNA